MIRRFTSFAIPVALCTLLGVFGCNGTTAPPVTLGTTPVDGHGAEGHPEEGPHQGHLIELGEEEYHAELAHDEATKTVTIYLLDKTAKVAVPIADPEIVLNLVVDGQPLQAKLIAAPQEGDPAGQSSRFSLTDEKVLEALEAPKTTGRLNLSIGGKPYIGAVEHHDHEEKNP